MTNCNPEVIRFARRCKGRKVEVSFSGGAITSDGGAMLLAAADQRLGLTEGAAKLVSDRRRKASCRHTVEVMLRQRVYGLALGYEDLCVGQQLEDHPVGKGKGIGSRLVG